jgi:predicted transcriptional regulator
MSAAAVMMRDFTYCHPRDVLQDVLSIMKERGFVQIPIIDQDSGPSAAPLTRTDILICRRPLLQLVQKRPTSKAVFG